MSGAVTDFQKAMLETYQDGRLSHLADAPSHQKLIAGLKKEDGTEFLVSLIESVKDVDDAAEAAARLLTAETDLQAAVAAVGAVSQARYLGR